MYFNGSNGRTLYPPSSPSSQLNVSLLLFLCYNYYAKLATVFPSPADTTGIWTPQSCFLNLVTA